MRAAGAPRIEAAPLPKKGRYRSGQTGRTVNPLAYAFVGSNPTLPIYPVKAGKSALVRTTSFLQNSRSFSTVGEMSEGEKEKTWEKTKVQHLVRHKSGRYYARLFLNSRDVWKSLGTSHFSVAEAKLADVLREHRRQKGRRLDPANAKMTFAEAASLDTKCLAEEATMKRRTRKYYGEVLASLLETWPGLAETQVRKITEQALKEWASRYAAAYSASRYNGTLSLLRRILGRAVENGVLYSNPAEQLERRAQKPKRLELPTRAQFGEFIAQMQSAKTRDAKNCAELAQGLAFTGCRISEAIELEWRDLHFNVLEILVKGDPDEATKNGEIRRVPMIQQAKDLFQQMRLDRADESASAKIFRVHECQHSMDRAAEKVGMPRITHHDLRHFFATVCIESGVDIPTVSRWLGHKDGGALAMRTYGHLRREHSIAQAQKVSFATIG